MGRQTSGGRHAAGVAQHVRSRPRRNDNRETERSQELHPEGQVLPIERGAQQADALAVQGFPPLGVDVVIQQPVPFGEEFGKRTRPRRRFRVALRVTLADVAEVDHSRAGLDAVDLAAVVAVPALEAPDSGRGTGAEPREAAARRHLPRRQQRHADRAGQAVVGMHHDRASQQLAESRHDCLVGGSSPLQHDQPPDGPPGDNFLQIVAGDRVGQPRAQIFEPDAAFLRPHQLESMNTVQREPRSQGFSARNAR